MISIRLPKEINDRLRDLAQETGRTKTYYVREAIVEHIDELDDIYLAMHRAEKPAKRWTQWELEKELDLEG